MPVIVKPDNPLLLPYRSQKDGAGIGKEYFIADGDKAVIKLLQSELEVENIFCLSNYYETHKALILQKLPEEKVFMASKEDMESFMGFPIHQGFMALAKKPKEKPITEIQSPVIVLNGLVDAENVGSIVRTSLAFGCKSLLIDEKTCEPYIRRAVRVALGNTFLLDIYRVKHLKEIFPLLKEKGFQMIAASARKMGEEKNRNVYEFSFPETFALVIGNEGRGIDSFVRHTADILLQIPISEEAGSLNAGLATAILLSHYQKEKFLKSGK
ncbi:MAG: RNA methyltransferase [Leptospiraceae bacterium]|nr:RNA methyltransferase [Leptospiraceae bacterium]